MTVIHLLVCQGRVALQWRQVAVGQGSAGSVMLTKDCIIDVMKAIARHQSVSTGGTTETLSMKAKHDTDEIQATNAHRNNMCIIQNCVTKLGNSI